MAGLNSLLGRLPAFRRSAGDRRGHDHFLGLASAALLAALATAARFVLDPVLPPGFPYLTYFPAVIVTSFVFGPLIGGFAGVLCGLGAWYWFIPPLNSFALTGPSGVALGFYGVVIAVDIALIHLAIRAYAAEARVHRRLGDLLDRQQLLSAEVDHRMRNMFTILAGLVSISQRHAATPAELADSLRSRIAAMGRSHSVLRGAIEGEVATLVDTVKAAVSPYDATHTRFDIGGPPVTPSGPAMLSVSLMLNELATNAVKYGALRSDAGRVSVSWTAEDRETVLLWKETGAPVAAPASPADAHREGQESGGFGSQLVATLAQGLGGRADFKFRADGVEVTIRMSTDLIAGDRQRS